MTVSRLLALPAHAAMPQVHVFGNMRGDLLNTNGITAILDLRRTGGRTSGGSSTANGTITCVQSGLCLDVAGAPTADGAPAQLWTCDSGGNQQWRLG